MVSTDDCGLMLEPQLGMSVQQILEWASYAERSGYGFILRSDHVLPTAQGKMMDSPECWVTLGAIAASTRAVRFGPLVSPVGFRNPALLARMACTLHSFTSGRLMLGIGVGWYEDEYTAHGYDFPKFQVRKEQLLEAAKIIRPLTEGKHIDFQGKYYAAHTSCLPKPDGKVHLIIGGKNPEVVEIAATYADEWNITNTSLGVFRNLKKLLESKHTGKGIEVSQMGPFIIGENESDLRLRLVEYSKLSGDPVAPEKLRERGILCGKVDDFITQMNEFIEAGVQKFYFQVFNTKNKEMVNLLTETLRAGM